MRAGDSGTAESICRKALNNFPRDANLLCLLGAALLQQRKARDAEFTLSRTVRLFGNFARAHEMLAEALMMQGKLPEALESLERAADLEPGKASVQLKKGKVLEGLGKDDEAAQAFESSFALTPHRDDLVRGLRLQRMGKYRDAEIIYRDVVVKDPQNVDALRLLAGVAMHAKQWSDAEALLERALDIAPDFIQCWMDLGLACQEQGRLEDAANAFQRAQRLEPERPGPYSSAATALAMGGKHEEALELFQRALEKDPAHANALTGLGHVLKTIGEQEKAIETYRDCLKRQPWHGETWWSLSELKTFRFDEEDVRVMEEQLANESLLDESRVAFHFALGKAYDDAGNYERAFEHFKAGSDNRREREQYDPVDSQDTHDKSIEVFNREFLREKAGCGDPSSAAIFIVGLPRSGSTLVEQILASHPDVEGTHELPELSLVAKSTGALVGERSRYPRAVPKLSDEQIHELGSDYLRRAERHRAMRKPLFTDKMPNNFAHVGFAKLIMQNCKIINARRHPLDSCLGSYKQLFARGQPFTYDLFELGEFYLEYQRLMDHWHEVLPGAVLDVQYEDVVDDIEPQVRRILEFCDLPWDDACLKFYESKRAVKTASSEQVRQPIYATSKHRWRNYERQLEPLIEILEPLLRELPESWQPESLRT